MTNSRRDRSGPLKHSELTLEVIDSIRQWTCDHIDSRISLLDGKGSQVLFLSYLYEHTGERELQALVEMMIGNAFDEIEHVPFDYANGLAGFLFAYQHLINEKIFSADPDTIEFLKDLDEQIETEIGEMESQRNYDLFFGIVGLGIYYLERYKFNKDPRYLEAIVDALQRFAVRNDEYITWVFQLGGEYNNKVNLGYVHGIPSLVAFLSVARSIGIRNVDICLLSAAVQSLLSFCRSSVAAGPTNRDRAHAFFPESFDLNEMLPGRKGRFAFCYGDVGAAYGLYRAGRLLHSDEISAIALNAAKHCATKTAEECEIDEACICHGSCGNLIVFSELYRSTGFSEFDAAARYWTNITTDLYERSGMKGLEFWDYDGINKNSFQRPSAGLLEGYAGIGLSLLSTITDRRPAWTRSLLL